MASHIFITGVGGFVGQRLATQLVTRGLTVSGSFYGDRPQLQGVDLVEVDVLDERAVADAVEAASPDVIIHLAALSHVGESWSHMASYFQVNVLGTENLLKVSKGRRLVLASSAEVYGAVPEERQPITEAEPLAPRTPYALTKAAAERLALTHGAVVVRSFNVVGPGQSNNFALPGFAAQLAAIEIGAAEPKLRVGNLEARRDFIHVDDAAEGYVTAALQGEPGEVYNLASGEARSIREMLDLLLSVAGLKVQVVQDPERLRPADVPLMCGDGSRLAAEGWSPRRGLQRALEDLWAAR